MFIEAINQGKKFTRPIHTISLNYGSDEVQPGAATIFFVNKEGWAVTCKHVAELILIERKIEPVWQKYSSDFQKLLGRKKLNQIEQELLRKYKFKKGQTIRIKNTFVDCINGASNNLKVKAHDTLDLALIQFVGGTIAANEFAKFPKNTGGLTPGKSLCRIGYPFPEFSNFEFNPATRDISWNNKGQSHTPLFPLDGMVTRKLSMDVNDKKEIVGFEMSTPGLRGQSGGPALDREGLVWGMQSRTAHFYLGFDVQQTVMKDGKKQNVKDSAFLHVGHCIHVDAIKNFLSYNNVEFEEI